MFTGIIEETGVIENVSKSGQTSTFTIQASTVLSDLKNGDSINTNGICLTVTKFTKDKGEFFKGFENIKDILFVRAGQKIIISETSE